MRLIYFLACLALTLCITNAQAEKTFEGFGSVTKGGEDGEIYHVTNLDNSGPGSLRDAISQGNRTVVFDVAGDIVVDSELQINVANLTIDGSTAPEPGITLKKSSMNITILAIKTNATDVIIRYIRLQGWWKPGDAAGGELPKVMLLVGSNISRIMLDHLTIRNASDSALDIWGEISNVSIQYTLITSNRHPQTISHYPAPFKKRRNLSIHHCIYSNNEERNPQIRADSRTIDYVNNIVYGWLWHGIRIKNNWAPNEPKVTANLINNVFIPSGSSSPARALIYGSDEGADSKDLGPMEALAQGTVYTESDMDSLYVSGNLLPLENMDQYSTISEPLPIPEYARVTTYDVSALADSMVPFVGTHYPLEDEIETLDAIQTYLKGVMPTNVKELSANTPESFYVNQNYPNPFNPVTIISFYLPTAQNVSVTVFDALGRQVLNLLNKKMPSGLQRFTFDGRNLPSGVYFYRVQTAQNMQIKKMLLLK